MALDQLAVKEVLSYLGVSGHERFRTMALGLIPFGPGAKNGASVNTLLMQTSASTWRAEKLRDLGTAQGDRISTPWCPSLSGGLRGTSLEKARRHVLQMLAPETQGAAVPVFCRLRRTDQCSSVKRCADAS